MNKRILLNIIIISLLTFYLIFNIVYRQLMDKHDPADASVSAEITTIWDGSVMIPKVWHLKRLELASAFIQKDADNNWFDKNQSIDNKKASKIVNAWQNLDASNAANYQHLPLDGQTLLAFIEEDSQPLIYRMVEDSTQIHFYRMIDQKQFSYPISAKSQLIP